MKFNLTQEWVTRITSALDAVEEPPVLGSDDADIDTEHVAWMMRYVARFAELGFSLKMAVADYCAGEPHDMTQDPVSAADDEISYMSDDG